MVYTREQCDKLKGDYFPRTGDCLYEGGSFGADKLTDQPYFIMLGAVGALAVGWYIFVRRK